MVTDVDCEYKALWGEPKKVSLSALHRAGATVLLFVHLFLLRGGLIAFSSPA